MTSHEDRKRERTKILLESIKTATEKGIGVDKNKLISFCCVDWGTTERKMQEYIKELIGAERIEYHEDGLIWMTKTKVI